MAELDMKTVGGVTAEAMDHLDKLPDGAVVDHVVLVVGASVPGDGGDNGEAGEEYAVTMFFASTEDRWARGGLLRDALRASDRRG